MLKILCLPGYSTNKEFMDFQLNSFKKYFKKELEFTIIDPPKTFLDRQLIEIDSSLIKFCKKTNTKPLHWWTYDDIALGPGYQEAHLDKGVDFLLDYLKKANKFDGFFGFSQGGLLLDYLFFKIEKYGINFDFLPKFAIISSPNYLGYKGDFLNWKRVKIPVILLIGEVDYFFLKGIFISLLYEKPLVIFHKEGHKIPNLNDEQIKDMKEFFYSFKGKMGSL